MSRPTASVSRVSFRRVKHQTESWGYVDVTCSACEVELKPVFPGHTDNDGVWEGLQAENALILNIEGGYGMFIENINVGPDEGLFILCERCVKKLMDENPWMAPFLKEHITAGVAHVCDDEQFVWVPYGDCMRSKTHGYNPLPREEDDAHH